MATLRINGFDCHYDYRHEDGAPCVVFLNGILSSLESWRAQADLACRLGYSVLCYEYRGQWRSEVTPGPYTMQTHVDDLAALLAALGIRQAHLVGTSYGGMTAMKFACRHPEAVASLMLIATTARIRPLSAHIVGNWCNPAAADDIESLFRTALPDLYSEDYLVGNPGLVEERLAGLRQAVAELPGFCAGHILLNRAQFPDISDGSLLGELAAIRCRTLVVAAGEDRLYPPRDSQAIADRIAGAHSLVVGKAGHAVVAEKPETINRLLAGHLLPD